MAEPNGSASTSSSSVIIDGSVLSVSALSAHNDSTSGTLKQFKTSTETICEQVAREGIVHKGQLELLALSTGHCTMASTGSKSLRQGKTWTALCKKANIPSADIDIMQQSFKELDKDGKACNALIKRLRKGDSCEETHKDLTSIKVCAGEMLTNWQQFLEAEAKNILPLVTKEMMAEDRQGLDMAVIQELSPKCLALLLASSTELAQQQLITDMQAHLGVIGKMRLLLAMQGTNRLWKRTVHLRRKYQKQLAELHKRGVLPKKLAKADNRSETKWSTSSIFSSCWQGTKYLSLRQSSQMSQQGDLAKPSTDTIKAVHSSTTSPTTGTATEPVEPSPTLSPTAPSTTSASISISSICTNTAPESPAVASPLIKDSPTAALVVGGDSSAAVAGGSNLHETISATMDQLRQQLSLRKTNALETSAVADDAVAGSSARV